MSYGLAAWGIARYGSAAVGLAIDYAWASSTNSVIVVLKAEPMHADPFAAGDAMNPGTWSLQNLSTLEFFTILAVREDDPPLRYELSLLEPLGSHVVQHRLTSTTLLSAFGELIGTPNYFDLAGVVVDLMPTAQTPLTYYQSRDLRNPPILTKSTGEIAGGGTLVIGSNGDYESEEGEALVRKLVLRRLMTPRGGFFHLPDYGLGLAVKEPIPGGDLMRLKAEIERQCMLEPDVDSALAALTMDRRNVLTMLLRVRMRGNGQTITIGAKADPNSGNLVEL